MNKIRLGIIGLGHVYEFQKQALQNIEEIVVVALCDIDELKACEEAKGFGAEYYSDYRKLLSNLEVDAVLLSTSVITHYEIGINVLNAKKQLLIEKPAVINLQELIKLQNTAVANSVKLITAYHAAFARDLLWFLGEYKEKLKYDLGPITGIDCQFFDPYIVNTILDKRAISLDGSWIDSGINALSVVVQLAEPNIIKKKDKLLIRRKDYTTPNTSAIVTFEALVPEGDNYDIIIQTDWTLEKNLKKSTLYFNKTGHKIILHHTNQQVIMINDKDETNILADFSSLDTRLVAHYKGVFNDFVDKVLNNKDNFEFTMNTHRLLLDNILYA